MRKQKQKKNIEQRKNKVNKKNQCLQQINVIMKYNKMSNKN